MILSICIPTYNFSGFIGETLGSIIPQLVEGTEIVILDGGSTDNTQEVVQNYQKICPQIKYFHREERGGIDHDMALSVAHAQGEYCWLFSSDDVMMPGALQKVLHAIKEGHDLYLCGFTMCGLDIRQILKEYPISHLPEGIVLNLCDPKEREVYFRAAIRSPAFFSFMSSLIVKKATWDKARGYEIFMESCWAHVARFFSLIKNQHAFNVKFLKESLLYKRSENDSFMERGLIYRLHIGVVNFLDIAVHFFGKKTEEFYQIQKSIQGEIGGVFRYAVSQTRSKQERAELKFLVKRLYEGYTVANCGGFLSYLLVEKSPPTIYEFCKKVVAFRKRSLKLEQAEEKTT